MSEFINNGGENILIVDGFVWWTPSEAILKAIAPHVEIYEILDESESLVGSELALKDMMIDCTGNYTFGVEVGHIKDCSNFVETKKFLMTCFTGEEILEQRTKDIYARLSRYTPSDDYFTALVEYIIDSYSGVEGAGDDGELDTFILEHIVKYQSELHKR